jgi:hypothetical protein
MLLSCSFLISYATEPFVEVERPHPRTFPKGPISCWYDLVWPEPEDLLQRHVEQPVNTLLLALHSVNPALSSKRPINAQENKHGYPP